MGSARVVIGIGVADLTFLNSKVERFLEVCSIFNWTQSNSIDSAIIIDPHGLNAITRLPKEIFQLLHVDLCHPTCHCQLVTIFLKFSWDIFERLQDNARFFLCALDCISFPCSCLTISDDQALFPEVKDILEQFLCLSKYRCLFWVFRVDFIEYKVFSLVIDYDGLACIFDWVAFFFVHIAAKFNWRHHSDAAVHLKIVRIQRFSQWCVQTNKIVSLQTLSANIEITRKTCVPGSTVSFFKWSSQAIAKSFDFITVPTIRRLIFD